MTQLGQTTGIPSTAACHFEVPATHKIRSTPTDVDPKLYFYTMHSFSSCGISAVSRATKQAGTASRCRGAFCTRPAVVCHPPKKQHLGGACGREANVVRARVLAVAAPSRPRPGWALACPAWSRKPEANERAASQAVDSSARSSMSSRISAMTSRHILIRSCLQSRRMTRSRSHAGSSGGSMATGCLIDADAVQC